MQRTGQRPVLFRSSAKQVRVRDLAAARVLYDVLMPALGLTDIVTGTGEVE